MVPLRSLDTVQVAVCSLVTDNSAVPGHRTVDLRSLGTVPVPLRSLGTVTFTLRSLGTVTLLVMSAATVTVTGRATEGEQYPGHGNSAVVIPGRVTGDVVLFAHRTGTCVNLRYSTVAFAFPWHVIGRVSSLGKLPVPLLSLCSITLQLRPLGRFR